MMAVVIAENESIKLHPPPAAASDNDNARPPPPAAKLLDPRLLMAARRGDSERLKELLQLKKDEEHAHAMVEEGEVAASSEVVIVEVVPRRRSPAPAASPPPPSSSRSAASAPMPLPLVDGVTSEGDTLLHVVAARGDGDDFLRCAKMIVHDYYGAGHKGGGGAAAMRLALEARNNKGDTPLHRAAAAGNANMISCLVHLIANTADDDEPETAVKKKLAFLRMQNKCGETALHQAVRAVRAADNKQVVACIDQLMDMDPELACIPHEDGASPLYLAISVGQLDVARHLLETTKGDLSYSGPDGRNVLHAAVSCVQDGAVPMVLKWLKELKTADDKMRQLTSQGDKENGSTPLHLAASWRGSPMRRQLLLGVGRRRVGRPPSPYTATELLLDADESTAYQADNKGLYPIHVASGAGRLDLVKTLLERCPECATLRDNKERTFLHVAAEEGHSSVVNYVCCQQDDDLNALLLSILNAQDINGDTALHYAVNAGYIEIAELLIRNRQVRLDMSNNLGITPLDVSWSTLPLDEYYAWDSRMQIRNAMLAAGASYGESRGDLFHNKDKHIGNILAKGAGDDMEEKMSENLKDSVQVLAIFSVLITTVTFASAFTLPGGYRSAGDDGGVAGTPVLAAGRSYVFDAFVLSDAVAFMSSLLATSSLLYAGVPTQTLHVRFRDVNRAYTLMWHAGRSLVAAFALGLYVVLFPVARTIAIAIIVSMTVSAQRLVKFSEGSRGSSYYVVMAGLGRASLRDRLVSAIIFFLEHFWSLIIIFGLPAIRQCWAKSPW